VEGNLVCSHLIHCGGGMQMENWRQVKGSAERKREYGIGLSIMMSLINSFLLITAH